MLVVLYWHFPSLSFLQGVKLIWLMLGNSSVFLPLLGNASLFLSTRKTRRRRKSSCRQPIVICKLTQSSWKRGTYSVAPTVFMSSLTGTWAAPACFLHYLCRAKQGF